MGGLYITMMNNYPLLMNTKSFVMILHQYIYDEYTLNIMKKCLENFFPQDNYTINIFLNQKRICIMTKLNTTESDISNFTKDVLDAMFNFISNPEIYSRIVESIINVEGPNTHTNKSPSLQILDNIMNHDQQTLSLLFEMHIINDSILINL